MAELPSGLVTFLFTDIESSTHRWEADPNDMRRALEHHDEILRTAVSCRGGQVFKHTGDGVAAVFTSPADAADAAISAQATLQTDDWGGVERLKVRMGLHIGNVEPTGNDYFGATVGRAARVMDIANGDQIAISALVAELLPDFDVRPMGEHRLKGIGSESIFTLQSPSLVVDERPLRSRVPSSIRSLPALPRQLIGRSQAVETVVSLLDEHPVVTIVGPGGVGKTSLALEVGHTVSALYPDGAVLCELAPLNDGASVTDAVAETLGARVQPGMSLSESIAHYLSGRRLLLILDNCEHVASDVGVLGEQLLAIEGTKILATSREPVAWPGEQLFTLDPLDAESDGITLFIERATERDYSFAPTEADREHIREICRRVDGIPLGIELAAAWARVLSPAELVTRLDDGFRVLHGGKAGTRHETLLNTILWSYEQLDETQARLFDRLSVFAEGFTLEAVEHVCSGDDLLATADVLDVVMALVDKSMVMGHRGAGRIRFTMLSTLRQLGAERLEASGETALYRSRHADYFSQLAKKEAAALISDRESEVWAQLDLEWGNIRAAFEELVEAGQGNDAGNLLLNLGWFATFSMRFEAFSWVDDLFKTASLDDHPDVGSLLGLRALGAYFTADDRCVSYADRGLEIDSADRLGFCRGALAAVSLNNEHTAEASETLTRAWLETIDATSSPSDRLWAEGMRTFHLISHAPSPEAATHAANLMLIATESGSATAMALARWASGMVATFTDISLALEEWHKGLDSARSLDEGHLLIPLITGLELHFTASRGDLERVVAHNLETLTAAHDLHYLAGTSHLFGVTAIVLCRLGQAEAGARLLGAMKANGHIPRRNAIRAVERALGESYETYEAFGTSLSIDEAAVFAINTLREAMAEAPVNA